MTLKATRPTIGPTIFGAPWTWWPLAEPEPRAARPMSLMSPRTDQDRPGPTRTAPCRPGPPKVQGPSKVAPGRPRSPKVAQGNPIRRRPHQAWRERRYGSAAGHPRRFAGWGLSGGAAGSPALAGPAVRGPLRRLPLLCATLSLPGSNSRIRPCAKFIDVVVRPTLHVSAFVIPCVRL